MKIIVGLGNPGKKYESTRHNAGFAAVEALRSIWKFEEWKIDKKSGSAVSSGTLNGEKIYLLKPQDFMNASGESVSKFASYHKTLPKDIFVIHDELDLPPGEARFAFNRGSAGHNGVQSVADCLGTKEFHRFRIGIGRSAEHDKSAETYVLEKFEDEENKILKTVLSEIAENIEKYLNEK